MILEGNLVKLYVDKTRDQLSATQWKNIKIKTEVKTKLRKQGEE